MFSFLTCRCLWPQLLLAERRSCCSPALTRGRRHSRTPGRRRSFRTPRRARLPVTSERARRDRGTLAQSRRVPGGRTPRPSLSVMTRAKTF